MKTERLSPIISYVHAISITIELLTVCKNNLHAINYRVLSLIQHYVTYRFTKFSIKTATRNFKTGTNRTIVSETNFPLARYFW